jgi:hemerythrin
LTLDKQEALKYLDDILEHLREHFNYEEEVMEKINYRIYINIKIFTEL